VRNGIGFLSRAVHQRNVGAAPAIGNVEMFSLA